MCKWFQSCLESLYWNCCEERFCYDESIAKYYDEDWENTKCYTNNIGSLDSLGPITRQPNNNNHINLDSNRLVLTDIPILAPDIYKVFAKSMIFKDDTDVKKFIENEESKQDFTKSTNYYNGHVGKVVTFEGDDKKDQDEEEVKFSDFEIMFQDELFGDHKIFKIVEEEEEENDSVKTSAASPTSLGVSADVQVPTSVVDTDSSDKKLDKGIEIPLHKQVSRVDSSKSITRLDSSKSITRLDSSKSITRMDSFKSITRDNSARSLQRTKSNILLSRTDSAKSFTRSNSRTDVNVRRVDSMKNLENKNFKNVLDKLPPKSASYLSIPQLLNQEEEKSKSANIYTISGEIDEPVQISKMPDTPVIKGSKFPKFFEETPVIGEYKADTSLQSIIKSPDVIFPESDYSMPRYYGKSRTIVTLANESIGQSSKSLPDLNEASTETMSKRLAKLGSRLKPLIIKRPEEQIKNSQHNL